ncbi:putative integral membrane protein [Acanthocheilonema viteae]
MSEEKSNTVIQDCQPCRYIGTGLFLFVAAYIWCNTRNTVYNGTLYRKLPLHLVAVGSMYMSLARFVYLPPFKHLAPKKSL